MRTQLIAVAAAALLQATPLVAAAQQSAPSGLRFGNAGFGGSESLTDPRSTGAEFSGGTTRDVGFNRGSIFGPDGVELNVGEIRGDSTRRLLAPQTTGAEASGGTPSPTGGAGGGTYGR